MNKWDIFAKQNAEYYILTHNKVDYSTTEGQNFFFNSGEVFTKESIQKVNHYLPSKKACLEIGCGIGRLTFAHAKIFTEVHAVDISETMLNKLNNLAKTKNIYNIKTYLPHTNWDKSNYFDYVYSFIVFQHIEHFHIIEEYIHRITKALSPTGIAQLHFETRPKNLLYYIRNSMPDFVLPRSQRKGIRRIRRDSKFLRDSFSKSKLEIVEEFFPDSANHIFILKKLI